MQLPFLVVHGGWLWPAVGVALVLLTFVIVRWRQGPMPKIDSEVAVRMQRRRMLSIVPTPVIAAVIVGFIYYFGMRGVGDALVGDNMSISRLTLGAATPKRRAALEKMYVELAPRTRQAGVLAARIELLRILGGRCEKIVEMLSLMSHFEAAIAEAARCTKTEIVLDDVERSQMALARFADAAKTIERRIALSAGERTWTLRNLAVLVAARDWTKVDEVATGIAKTASSQSPAAAGQMTCIALAARQRAGNNTAALEALRTAARSGTPGTGLCMLFLADATASRDELQLLTAFPLDAGHLAGSASGEPSGGDVLATYLSYAENPAAPPTVAIAPSPHDFFKMQLELRGPGTWADRGEDMNDLRQLVLAVHAPGDSRNLVAAGFDTDVSSSALVFQGPDRQQLGMRLRAARALWPQRTGADAAEALISMLYTVGTSYSNIGDHARAETFIAAAIDLERGLATTPHDHKRVHERASAAAALVLLRRGDAKGARTVIDRAKAVPVEHGDRLLISSLIERLVGVGVGDDDELQRAAGLNIEPQRPAIRRALAGDGADLAQLPFEHLGNIRVALPYLARYVKNPGVLAELVTNFPMLDASSLVDYFGVLGDYLHFAEAARHTALAASLHQRMATYFEAMTANDTSLMLAALAVLGD